MRLTQSSVAPAEWLPIVEELLEGAGHAMGNRIAALSGIAQLLEANLASREEGARAVSLDAKLLRPHMDLLRALAVKQSDRREPARASEQLRAAAGLLAQHSAGRVHRIEIADEPADVEPLLLWPADHLRAPLLLLLASTEGAKKDLVVRVSIHAHEGAVLITARTPLTPAEVEGAARFAALQRFAKLEGGACTSAAAPDGTTALVLELPGLTRASTPRA